MMDIPVKPHVHVQPPLQLGQYRNDVVQSAQLVRLQRCILHLRSIAVPSDWVPHRETLVGAS